MVWRSGVGWAPDLALPDGTKINSNDVQCVKEMLNIGFNHSFLHLPKFVSPKDSSTFVDWLVEQHRKNPHFFEKVREQGYSQRQFKKPT